MRIGLVGPINPAEFGSFFPNCDVPKMNLNASSVQALVKSYLDDGHTVSIFTTNENNIYQEFTSEQLKVYAVPYRWIPRTSILQVYKVVQLKKAIQTHLNELDVLHAQWTYEYAYAAKAFANQIPVFCTVRDWCPYIMKMVSRTFLGAFGWRIKYYMFRRVMANNDIHFIANSHYTYQRIKTDYPDKEVAIIPNSIKKEYILTKRKNVPNSIRLITIANGIFDPRKNLVTLLRAFKRFREQYSEASLTIVGRFSETHPDYVKWKEDGLFDDVVTTGQLSHEGVIDQIDASTMLIHPSLEETFGNILLEAMARRVPVIGGVESGAVPMVLGHGKYGVCCDVSNPNEILKAIQLLLDENKAIEVVDAATEHLQSTYASDVVCYNHIKLFQRYVK